MFYRVSGMNAPNSSINDNYRSNESRVTAKKQNNYQLPTIAQSLLRYPYYMFGDPPENSIPYPDEEDIVSRLILDPFESKQFTKEEIDELTSCIQILVFKDKKIIRFSTKAKTIENLTPEENTFINVAIFLHIRNRANFIFPFVVIENVELSISEANDLNEIFENDKRIIKVMFNRVNFEKNAIFYFSLSKKMVEEIIFVDCTMSEQEKGYLKLERGQHAITFIIVNSNKK